MSQAPSPPISIQAYLIITVGVAAVSLAAIFIRLAQEQAVPSLAIAAGRVAIAALILTPITLRRADYQRQIRALTRSELRLAALAGLFLALHFATWILSLEHTSVLISVVLVTTNPLWAALLERIFLRAHLPKRVLTGLVIALGGGLVISLSGNEPFSAGENPLLGGTLALIGAIAVGAYFVIGRRLRAELALIPYIWLVYGIAAIILFIVIGITGTALSGYPLRGYLWLVAVALIPQLVGHSSFNFALRFVPATVVGILLQLEPAASAMIAFVVFQEIPTGLQIVGSGIILAGVGMATLSGSGERHAASPAQTG